MTAADAALVFALAVATFLLVAIAAGGGLAGLAVAEGVGLAVVPILAVRARGLPLASLGLTRAPAGAMLGATLVGASLWFVNLRLAEPIKNALDDHGEATSQIEALMVSTPIATIIVLTVVPAICEELACRGLLALGLRARLGRAAAIAISAVAFAALHLSLVRAAPTLVLGAALAVLAVRSGSILPSMLAHGLNNAIALLLFAGYLAPLDDAVSSHPDVAVVVAASIAIAGLGIAWKTSGTRS